MNLVGWDLGKRTDHAAVSVFTRSMREKQRRYLCRAMRRWPLGTKYVSVVEDVRRMCGSPLLQTDPLTGKPEKPMLLVDATGVGEPIVELAELVKIDANLIAISITGGKAAHVDEACPWHWYVPQHLLVGAFETVLRTSRFDWPRDVRDPLTGENMKAVLMGEVKDLRVKNQNIKRPPSYGAQQGSHDDVLMSAAYVAWWGER